jgi:hypothetical protein
MLQDYHTINQVYLTEIYYSDKFAPKPKAVTAKEFDRAKVKMYLFVRDVLEKQEGKWELPNGEFANVKEMVTSISQCTTPEQLQRMWDDYAFEYYTEKQTPFD